MALRAVVPFQFVQKNYPLTEILFTHYEQLWEVNGKATMAATALPSLGDSNVDKSRSRTTGAGTKWLWDASELTLSDDKSGKQGITKTLPYFTKRPPIRVVHWRQRDASEHRWRRAEWPSISFPNYSLKESSKTQHHITENSRGTMLSNATMSSPLLGQAIRSSNGSPSNTTEGFEEILLQLPPGVKNAIAIHAVMGMGLLVLLLLCFFMCVIFLMRFYYKDRENELLLGTSMANDFPAIRIQKEKSPYVITPTQKITQRFLSGQKTPSMIECNFEDIAGILHFMASYIEIVDDVPFRPAHLKARLVPRARTKFDGEHTCEPCCSTLRHADTSHKKCVAHSSKCAALCVGLSAPQRMPTNQIHRHLHSRLSRASRK
uniref:TPX2 C-terminal domain-containing protein n=1 Tax=Parascaris univalens TaxID=6257 RepID=A0A914ZX79_PARUN